MADSEEFQAASDVFMAWARGEHDRKGLSGNDAVFVGISPDFFSGESSCPKLRCSSSGLDLGRRARKGHRGKRQAREAKKIPPGEVRPGQSN